MIKGVNLLRKKDLKNANVLLRQLLDNALLSAGMLLDTKFFVNRVNELMENNMNSLLANKLDDGSSSAHRQEVIFLGLMGCRSRVVLEMTPIAF